MIDPASAKPEKLEERLRRIKQITTRDPEHAAREQLSTVYTLLPDILNGIVGQIREQFEPRIHIGFGGITNNLDIGTCSSMVSFQHSNFSQQRQITISLVRSGYKIHVLSAPRETAKVFNQSATNGEREWGTLQLSDPGKLGLLAQILERIIGEEFED